jgi:integrase
VNGAAKLSVSCFLITWLWEWCIRNRLHHTKVLKLCRLFDGLLAHVGTLAEKDAKYLTREHVAKFIFDRRVKGYAPAVINDDINYLKTMARDLELLTGVNVAELLEVEAKETQERLPFKWAEVLKIFEALDSLGKLGREWKTFLLIMLYTGLRPCDAALVTRGQIDLEQQLIWADASKTRRFAGDKIPRVIHDALFAYLDDLLTKFPLKSEDSLCLNFANRSQKSITNSFNKIMKMAGVSKQTVKTPYLQGKFSKKTLYSFRHTFNVLLMSVGADRPQRKTEMGQKTDESQKHYEHDQEPEVIATRRKLINLLPRVPVNVSN